MNTIRTLFSAVLVAGFSMAATAEVTGPKWKLDADHSSVGFSVTHFFTPVAGTFGEIKARVRFDPDDVSNSSFEAMIPVNSIDTAKKKRDKHLMSGDFFGAKQWPNISFVSESVEKVDDKHFNMNGKLTIRDVTKDVTLPVEVLGVGEVKMNLIGKTTVAGLKIETSINRNDYGVGTGSWAATAVVGEEVQLKILLELHR